MTKKKQELSLLVSLVKKGQKTKAAFTIGILDQKWQRKNKKLSPLVSLAEKAKKMKNFTNGNLGQIWPRQTKTFTFGNLGQK